MARVTVEDCLGKVNNRFELVLTATKRARQLAHGKEALVEWENDKPTVVALREIAENKISAEMLAEEERREAEESSVTSEDEVAAEIGQMLEEGGNAA